MSAVLSAINEVDGSMQGCFLQITYLSVGLTINRWTPGVITAFKGKEKKKKGPNEQHNDNSD